MFKLKRYLALVLATGFGVGYLPLAPGTWGSALMAFLGWWLLDLPPCWYLATAGAVFLLGIITAPLADKHLSIKSNKVSDNNQIVVDEFLGMMVALLPIYFFEKICWWLLVGFLLFRVFDVFKFGPAKFFDKFKNQWGVMLDDLLAGVQAGLVLLIILWLI